MAIFGFGKSPTSFWGKKVPVEEKKSLPTSDFMAPSWQFVPGNTFNYKGKVGDPSTNSIVAAVISYFKRTATEPDLQVISKKTGDPIPNHPATKLFANPNKYLTIDDMLSLAIHDSIIFGNAYWVKERDSRRVVKSLAFIPSQSVSLRYDTLGLPVSYYVRNGRSTVILPFEDVIHFKFAVDPKNPYTGTSPIISVYKEIEADNEVSSYTAAILRNMGIPGVAISNKDPMIEMTQEKADALKAKYVASTVGEHRGEPLVFGSEIEIKNLGFSPQQMEVTDLSETPEERICSVFGINPLLLGLSGDKNTTYNNLMESRRAFYESTLVPLWENYSQVLNSSLLVDTGNPDTESIEFAYTDLSSLKENRANVVDETIKLVGAGIISIDEARAKLEVV